MAGQPVSHQRISDDSVTMPKDRTAVNEMRVLVTVYKEMDFSARIVPGAKGLDSTSRLIAILSMLYPNGVFASC